MKLMIVLCGHWSDAIPTIGLWCLIALVTGLVLGKLTAYLKTNVTDELSDLQNEVNRLSKELELKELKNQLNNKL